MSHFIVDDFAVAHFNGAELRAAFDHWSFHGDHYMFFELGGDNNVFQVHPVHRREIRSRNWHLMAIGQEWEVMRQIVKQASSCEGGGLRFSGERDTKAETYIRKARNAIAAAAPPSSFGAASITCTVTLKIASAPDMGKSRQEAIEVLSSAVDPHSEGEALVWTLYPLRDIQHAALMFVFAGLDDRAIYNKARVSGREYAGTPLVNRLNQFRQIEIAGL